MYVKLNNLMSNSVDLDETAHYEPSHLDLRCLLKPATISVALKEFSSWVAYRIIYLGDDISVSQHRKSILLNPRRHEIRTHASSVHTRMQSQSL